MDFKIEDLIKARKKRFEFYIQEEKMFQETDGAKGSHCTNAEDLQHMLDTWSDEEWIQYVVKTDSDIYIFDLNNMTYKTGTPGLPR